MEKRGDEEMITEEYLTVGDKDGNEGDVECILSNDIDNNRASYIKEQATTTEHELNKNAVDSSSSAGFGGRTPQKKHQSNPKILWITNVPKNTRANDLKQLLSFCGKVVCAKVVVNAKFPGSCCFGYVIMGSACDATNVINKLNNTEFNGQIIKIDKFENIKPDNLTLLKKSKDLEELKKTSPSEIADNKSSGSKCKEVELTRVDDNTVKNMESNKRSAETKSVISDRSSRERRTSSRDRFKERQQLSHRRSHSGSLHRANVLTFDKIKKERERQRLRDRDRALREDNRRRYEEAMRLKEMREISRRQRSEAERLIREREKLRIERDKIEREKGELIKLERERQRIEREKLEVEKMEIQRSRLRLEENRRAVKRPVVVPYKKTDPLVHDRKKSRFDRQFDEGPHHSRFPPVRDPSLSKRFPFSKDYKDESFNETFSKKRDRRDHIPKRQECLTRSDNPGKASKSYDNIRDSHSNFTGRMKESKFVERNPHFRPTLDVPKHFSQRKLDRGHPYPSSNDRWDQGSTHPLKMFESNDLKPWTSRGENWHSEVSNSDRWNQGPDFSGRSSISHTANITPSCPPPPGINNYSDRFDYNKSSIIRKY